MTEAEQRVREFLAKGDETGTAEIDADDLRSLLDTIERQREALETIRSEPPVNYDSSINAERIIRLVEIANAALQENSGD